MSEFFTDILLGTVEPTVTGGGMDLEMHLDSQMYCPKDIKALWKHLDATKARTKKGGPS